MKKILFTLLLCAMLLNTFAQKSPEARKVLDATASYISSLKAITTTFSVDYYVSGQKQGSETGTMQLNGKKFKLTTREMTTWYDGNTQWAYLSSTNEINISTPTPEEMNVANPYSFLWIYQKGYNYTLTSTTYRGQAAYEVRLLAENQKAEIPEILLTVSKNHHPLCVRVRQGKKNWTRITLHSLMGKQKFSKDIFVFPKAQYPQAEVIDLR